MIMEVKMVNGDVNTISGKTAEEVYKYFTEVTGRVVTGSLGWVGSSNGVVNLQNATSIKFIKEDEE